MTFNLEQLHARLQAANPIPPSFAHLHVAYLWQRLAGQICGDLVFDDGEEVEAVKLITPTPELLTLKQAAAYLSISSDQVAAFAHDGELKFINIGRGDTRPRFRFHKQDLDAFIERRRQSGEAQCLSTKRPTRRIGNSTSSTVVSDFMALRAAQIAKRPKPTKR